MARRQYIIAYDISDDKRRTAVFKTLIGQGDHVQYSVFLCTLNPRELAELRGRLDEIIHSSDDQIILVDLGKSSDDSDARIDCLGKRYHPSTRTTIV